MRTTPEALANRLRATGHPAERLNDSNAVLVRDAVRVTDLPEFADGLCQPQDATSQAALLAAVAAAREGGVTVAFDPNLRPRLWPDGDEMRDWIMRGAAVADVGLPSFDDEAGHFGDASPEATVARYRAAGIATVMVKNGAGTVLAAGPGGEVRVDPVPVDEVYAATESPNGELGFYLVGNGTTRSYRAHTRAPSFIHFAMFPHMIRGYQLSDLVAVLGSINIIAAELDR